MGTRSYSSITLRRELLDQVDKCIKRHPEMAILSRAEAVKIAVREWITRNGEPDEHG